MDELQILESTKTFAIIGASAKKDSYGFELVKVLTDLKFTVFPINPKYPEIYGIKTYASIDDLKEIPENIVLAMSAINNTKFIDNIAKYTHSYIWMPPECWNQELVEKAKKLELKYLLDLCPIGSYLRLNVLKQARKN